MQVLHFTIIPSVALIFSIILQYWLTKKEFVQYFKMYLLGLIAGILIFIIFSFFNTFFLRSAHHLTIFFKSLFIDGLLFSVLICVSLYFIYVFLVQIILTATWSMTSILSFAYLSGIYTTIHIIQSISGNFPNSPVVYISFISFLFFISLILGIGIPHFFDSYEMYKKILWAMFSIGILAVSFLIYSYLIFYNYYLHYFFIAAFVILLIFFEKFDFKYFRQR